MTNKQKLTELIQLAVDNGWDEFGHTEEHFWAFEQKPQYLLVEIVDNETSVGYNYDVSTILFDHGFAKAVFGKKLVEDGYTIEDGDRVESKIVSYPWKKHLQQLAITHEDERISYAYENRRRHA